MKIPMSALFEKRNPLKPHKALQSHPLTSNRIYHNTPNLYSREENGPTIYCLEIPPKPYFEAVGS